MVHFTPTMQSSLQTTLIVVGFPLPMGTLALHTVKATHNLCRMENSPAGVQARQHATQVQLCDGCKPTMLCHAEYEQARTHSIGSGCSSSARCKHLQGGDASRGGGGKRGCEQ